MKEWVELPSTHAPPRVHSIAAEVTGFIASKIQGRRQELTLQKLPLTSTSVPSHTHTHSRKLADHMGTSVAYIMEPLPT